ncbi:MAG: DUF2065 domain-containing protein [Pseudomonadota bacterium]
MVWHDLLAAFALVLVIEGILPFASPRGARSAFEAASRMDDRILRLVGLTSMLAGLLLLYLVK